MHKMPESFSRTLRHFTGTTCRGLTDGISDPESAVPLRAVRKYHTSDLHLTSPSSRHCVDGQDGVHIWGSTLWLPLSVTIFSPPSTPWGEPVLLAFRAAGIKPPICQTRFPNLAARNKLQVRHRSIFHVAAFFLRLLRTTPLLWKIFLPSTALQRTYGRTLP